MISYIIDIAGYQCVHRVPTTNQLLVLRFLVSISVTHHDSHATSVFHIISLYFVLCLSTSGTVLLLPEPHSDGMYHMYCFL